MYTGIWVGGVWGYGPSVSKENRVEFNHLHDVGQRFLSDMGGIYTRGVSPGTVIRGNHIHDVDSWTYGGWGDSTFVAGEVRDPGRTLPRAVLTGAALLTGIFLLVNLAYLHVLTPAEMAGSRLIAATAAERIPLLGHRGGAIVSALVVLATFSALHASMMTGPRVFFGLADRGLFFRPVARVSPRFGTPSVAIGWATALGVIFVLTGDFRELANRFILGTWPFYALAVLAVFVLRRTRPDLPRPYRAWGYPAVPAVFLLASAWLMVNALVTDTINTGITFLVILAGVPVYWVWHRRRSA
jgi:amino acid transporter